MERDEHARGEEEEEALDHGLDEHARSAGDREREYGSVPFLLEIGDIILGIVKK